MKIIDRATPGLRKFKPGTILKVSDGVDDADYLFVAYSNGKDRRLQLINLENGVVFDDDIDPSKNIENYFQEALDISVYRTMKLVLDDED
jgi:hypothetical protein